MTWADYSSKTIHDDDVIDLEKLSKKYSDNIEKGKRIKNLSALKFDIKAIRADLANFCFSLISVTFPDHPLLSDTSNCEQAPMEFSDLYAAIDDSLNSDKSTSGSSDSDSYQGIFITKNPIENYKIDTRSEAQIKAEHLAAIKSGVKSEPVDLDAQKFSTPIASPKK